MAFWGLVLEPNKNYIQQEVEQPFHISMATLDMQNSDPNEPYVTVLVRKRDSEFILCNLSRKHHIYNVRLNLDFELGGEINFHVLGNSTVHLTGYIGSVESSANRVKSAHNDYSKPTKVDSIKRKPDSAPKNNSKKLKLEEIEEEEDDSDYDMNADFDMDDSDGEDEDVEEEDEDDDDDDEDEDDDDDEDDEDEDDPVPQQKEKPKQQQQKQQPHKQQQQQAKKQQGANASPKGTPKPNQQGKNQPKGQTPQQSKNGANGTPSEAKSSSRVVKGVTVQDLVVGTGPVAKTGRSVSVYYEGRLKSNNKKFDSTSSGPGFQFRLGRSEVIKGWDYGLEGMKVGGKRRLVIPPKLAYGEKGAGSAIPPNAALVFDVELKRVK